MAKAAIVKMIAPRSKVQNDGGAQKLFSRLVRSSTRWFFAGSFARRFHSTFVDSPAPIV
jgi:hypothetical protein